jgi:hypothetical protein
MVLVGHHLGFLSLINHLDAECDQVNIKAMFLYGKLKEIIHFFTHLGRDILSDKILLFRKSLSLAQAITEVLQQDL